MWGIRSKNQSIHLEEFLIYVPDEIFTNSLLNKLTLTLEKDFKLLCKALQAWISVLSREDEYV